MSKHNNKGNYQLIQPTYYQSSNRLYSDHDIFIRELVSNAFDAITKRSKLSTLDDTIEFDESPTISITIDKRRKH